MNLRSEILSIIGEFSGQNNHLNIPVAFIKMTGDINQAILLNQIIYWSDRSSRKDGYFYKSYPEWSEEIFLTKYQVTTAANKLKEKGLISTKLMKANGAPTLHYRVQSNSLYDWIVKYLTMDSEKTENGKLSNLTMDSEETEQSIVKKLDDGKSRNLTMDSKETCLSTITEITTKNTTENTTKTTTEKEHDDQDTHSDDYKEVLEYMQNECGFGLIAPRVYEDVLDEIKLTNKEIVMYGIEVATFQGKPHWNYVKGILRNWRQARLQTLDDVKAYQNKRAAQPTFSRFNTPKEAVQPKWFNSEPLQEKSDSPQSKVDETPDIDIADRIKAFRKESSIGK